MSKIEYCTETWNPVTGCSPISEGCQNCYARRLAETRLRGRCGYPADDPFRVTFHPNRLKTFKKGVIFVCDMGDLFHGFAKRSWQIEIFDCMLESACSFGTQFLLLTKRPILLAMFIDSYSYSRHIRHFPTIYAGVSVENQETADEQIPELLKLRPYFPVLWVSAEPLLGPIDIERFRWYAASKKIGFIDQLVIGCESGLKRRPMQIDWAIDLIRQAKEAEIKVFVKQVAIKRDYPWSEKSVVSHDPEDWPPDLRVRELLW